MNVRMNVRMNSSFYKMSRNVSVFNKLCKDFTKGIRYNRNMRRVLNKKREVISKWRKFR
ncbi:hypothetical protein CLOSTHATH_06662 [Hungatella hathewayi DSM 13479]|uniref:Uncharacterized protein n=1 Tax=Hungatella hathewayi DSM 13479 TaxID=566550 RepID=D3ASQ4_9FIRM|nr:hypothetical protein CLOSTHATH_06662 [Hungatella hathewayi DSM 13479]